MIVKRAGRKRKSRVIRDSRGVSRGDPLEVVKSVVWAQRAKIMPIEWVREDEAGYVLGILYLRHKASAEDPSGITLVQKDAGNQWAGIVRRHAVVMGYELRPQRAAGFERLSPTTGNPFEDDPEMIAHIRDRFGACWDALAETCRTPSRHGRPYGMRLMDITYAVCVDNRMPETQSDFGYLRLGLNALARALK
jgi:hypothetical protein